MLSLEGKQLGNYDVVRRISVGGMGAVYEGRQRTAFDRRVAIKVILGDYASDRDMRRRFAREARIIARLHHPHILPLIEFGDEQGILYLVMPFVEGGTLTRYLRRALPDLAEVAAIFQQLLDAVEHAHEQGLIHRDIKSSNVLLELNRVGMPYAYLADFGLVRTIQQSEMDTEKTIPLDQVPGTPHYMAPEQTRGIITPQTDIYALGVLLYQLLTGNLPYDAPDDIKVIHMHLYAPIPRPGEHDASIPREMDDVVHKAMAKRAADRYGSISEFRNAFLAAIKGPVSTLPIIDDVEEVLQEGFLPLPSKRVSPIPIELQEPVGLVGAGGVGKTGKAGEAEEVGAGTPTPTERRRALPARRLRKAALPAAAISLPPGRRRGRGRGNGRNERDERENERGTERGVERRSLQVRTTGSIGPQGQRITEEPLPMRRRRLSAWAITSIIASVLLLTLVLMPRVLGMSFFPAGFPIFGASPIATIYITAQSQTLQNRYVLTASPQVKTPDLATHSLPAHTIQDQLSGTTLISTTGRKTVAAAQAHGTIIFSNTTDNTISVPASLQFSTPSGIQIQLAQNKDIPPHHDGQDGTASVAAVAVAPGAAGNIAAHALDGSCCNNGLTAKNPQAFTGGQDPQDVHTVLQSDLDGVQKTLAPGLEQQLLMQLGKQLAAGEVIAGQPAYQVNVTANHSPGVQADQVQVMVNVTGKATVYNRSAASVMAIQLLSQQAAQSLDKAFQLQGAPTITLPSSIDGSKGDMVYLSVSARGLWVYKFTAEQMSQWQQSIKGATMAAAAAYLKGQPGIASSSIQLPFNTDHLPSTVEDIKVVVK